MNILQNIWDWKRRCAVESSFNVVLFLATIVVGILLWVIDLAIYKVATDIIPRPILIAILFSTLYIVLGIVVSIISRVYGAFETNLLTWTNGDRNGVLIILTIGLLAVFCLSALFQWIYGLNIVQQDLTPTSYIFVIDDSGSMGNNDPAQERYAAIASVLEGVDSDFPVMIYSFASDTTCLREMAPISDGIPQIVGNSEGGTQIKGALTTVIDDYDSKRWDGGNAPRIILLSDGKASDIGLFSPIRSLLRRYSSSNITISTIGLGDDDVSQMTKIAESTGGIYVHIENVAELSSAMDTATSLLASRDLLSTRRGVNANILYGIMRVLFLTILGAGIGFLMSLAYGNQSTYVLNSVAAPIATLLGALLLEVGTNAGLSQKMLWFLLWVLISATLGLYPKRQHWDSEEYDTFNLGQYDTYEQDTSGYIGETNLSDNYTPGGYISR